MQDLSPRLFSTAGCTRRRWKCPIAGSTGKRLGNTLETRWELGIEQATTTEVEGVENRKKRVEHWIKN